MDGVTYSNPLVEDIYKKRRISDAFLSDWREKAAIWFDLVSNNQWSTAEQADLEEKNRIPVQFNRVGAVINAICGSEVSNRMGVKYLPRTIGDVNTNDVLNAAASWARDETDAEDEDSDAFRDLTICGYGWTETLMDYEENPDGKVVIRRRNPLAMRYDPAARRRNLADAKWVQAEDLLSKEQIIARWGEDKFGEMNLNLEVPDDVDSPHNASEAWLYKNDQGGKEAKEGVYKVIHHCWYETKKMFKVLDPNTQKVVELEPEKYDKIKELPIFSTAKAVKFDKRVYKHAFVGCGTILEEGDAPCQCSFPYEAMTGYRHQTKGWFYGVVWPMQDPQKFANKFLSQLMHIFSSNAKGGLMAERGAIDNPRQFEQNWSKADSVSYVAEGAIANNRIKDKPLPPYPTQAEHLLRFCVESLPMTSGVNVEMLGLADRQQAGIVEAQRTKAALTILANLFDALRLYRKRQGRMLAYFILEYLSDGRLIRITGNSGDMQYIHFMKQRDFMEYDVIVDEAVNSRDVKERTWAIMSQLLPMLKSMGVPIPPAVLDYSPLPTGLISEWKQEIDKARKNPPPDPIMVQHQNNMQEIQAKAQAEVQVKSAEAQIEGQKAQSQGSEIAIKAQVDLQIADITARKDVQIAEYKANKEAETALMVAKIKADADAQVKNQQMLMQAQQAQRQEAIAAEQSQKEEENAGKPAKLEIEGLSDLVSAIANPPKRTRKAKKGPDGTFTMTEE